MAALERSASAPGPRTSCPPYLFPTSLPSAPLRLGEGGVMQQCCSAEILLSWWDRRPAGPGKGGTGGTPVPPARRSLTEHNSFSLRPAARGLLLLVLREEALMLVPAAMVVIGQAEEGNPQADDQHQ